MNTRSAGIALLLACLIAGAIYGLTPVPDALPHAGAGGVRTELLGGEPILPLPLKADWDPAKAQLGELIFHDRRLSVNRATSCASCHDAGKGRADNVPFSTQFDGQLTQVNTPTLFNVRYNFKLFWTGHADTLWQEFDMNRTGGVDWDRVPARLRADPDYARRFARLYPEQGLSTRTLRDALFHYENSLVTPDGRFDRFLRGESAAISATERHGYQLFKSYGCVACHQGVNVGGNLFQKFGVLGDYFADRGKTPTRADLGRYALTRRDADRFFFRVPSLRNVALTAPYFHDGSASTLEEAVTVMARYQLGRPVPETDLTAIVAFLKTLTGTYRGGSLALPLAPQAPKS